MRYPHYENQVRSLVEAHRHNLAEAVLLALYYTPGSTSEDVYVFEVLSPSGEDTASLEGRMLSVEFASTPDFPISEGGKLHITITTPAELSEAVAKDWPEVQDIRNAIGHQQCRTLHEDAQIQGLSELLLRTPMRSAA